MTYKPKRKPSRLRILLVSAVIVATLLLVALLIRLPYWQTTTRPCDWLTPTASGMSRVMDQAERLRVCR